MKGYVTQAWLQSHLPGTMQQFAKRWRDDSHRDHETYLALYLAGQHLGHLQGQRAEQVLNALSQEQIPFRKSAGMLELLCPAEQLEFTLAQLGASLHQQGLVPGWRDELHTLYDQQGLPLCNIERALFKVMGLCSQAVHVHAETQNGLVWLGVRSCSKHENPGMLDNLTAGGIGAQEPIKESIVRELQEEAGFCDLTKLVNRPCFSGFLDLNSILQNNEPFEAWHQCAVQVSRPLINGWHHELIILCHLRLNDSWVPCNQDGEVAGFELMSQADCAQAVDNWTLTPDAALATALALAQSNTANLKQ